jgi:Ca2+-binding EF-hand superfamily protein
MDLKTAFDAVSQGEDFVNRESLNASFSNLGIFPSEEMLDELLLSIGKLKEEDMITFDVFARCVALLLEENAEKISTSSQQNQGEEEYEEMQDGEYHQQYYGQEVDQEQMYDEDYYNELAAQERMA